MNKIVMKALVTLVVGFALSSCTKDKSDRKFVRIEVEPTRQDIGQVEEGEEATFTYNLSNTGDVPVKLKLLRSSCGSSGVSFSQQELPLGETSTVRVTVDTGSRAGRFSVETWIEARATDETLSPQQVNLLGVALIHRPAKVWADPSVLRAEVSANDKNTSIAVDFSWKTLEDTRIDRSKTTITSSMGTILVEKILAVTLSEGWRRLVVKARLHLPKMKVGTHRGSVVAQLVLANGQERKIIVPVVIAAAQP